jgi:hypothetical protein
VRVPLRDYHWLRPKAALGYSVSFLVALVPYVAKKKSGRKSHKTRKRRTCYDVYVQLEDDAVTVYSGTPGGHTRKGTKLAKNSRHVRGDAGALNLECGESGAARRFCRVWS